MSATGKKRWVKWGPLLLVASLAAGGGGWYWQQRSRETVQYQTAPVTRGPMTQAVTATGQLNPVTNVTVGCQISGTLAEVLADYNVPVTNGQVVAQIDPATYQANVQLARADVANAKAGLELTTVNARRAKELFDAKLIPQSDYDTAIANLHQSEAVLLNKQASLNRAEVDLRRCTIYSPVDGIVISRNVDVGQTVAASLSAPTLFTIANDLTKMQIDANVAEADVGGIEVDQLVDFSVDAFPYRTFHGKVRQVRSAPITVQNVVTYDTVIDVSNPDLKLKPGMTANVSIVITQRLDCLSIPNAALRFRPPENTNAPPRMVGGGSRHNSNHKPERMVYTVQNDKPEPVAIKTGITDGVSTEVLEGLSENDKVITAAITKSGNAPPASNPFSGGMRFR